LVGKRPRRSLCPRAQQVTLEWVRHKRLMWRYRFFIFLNSSVRGPFIPSYLPAGWHWPRAFTDRLSEDVKIAASSIVCLPGVDIGGLGPRARVPRGPLPSHNGQAVRAGLHAPGPSPRGTICQAADSERIMSKQGSSTMYDSGRGTGWLQSDHTE